MKILFISAGGQTQDYLRDCAFRGFRELFGADVVDVGKLDSMYIGADRSSMYGMGMTLYAELPDIVVDRTDIPRKIRDKFWDLVIYGSIHRNQDYLHEVLSKYDAQHVVALDGEDHPGALMGLPVTYFKRELFNPLPGLHPIQFAIPASKILSAPPKKTRLMAPCDPIDTTTYIYKDEASYYAQYAESYYGATMKKAGWDCMRHYEIMANWCLPYFRCLDQCPRTIMELLPKFILLCIQEEWDKFGPPVPGKVMPETSPKMEALYSLSIEQVVNSLRERLTTEKLAEYILNTVGVATKETMCA